MPDGEPLNPVLYRNLKRVFGKVLISNEGQAMNARYVPRVYEEGEELYIENPGEYYRVNCDICNDTRHRLYINHRFARRDEKGRQNLWLAVCYNENCYSGSLARFDLLESLNALASRLEVAPIAEGTERIEAHNVTPPGPITPLNQLEPDHPANAYLASRYFNPERLAKYYGVGYCSNSIYTFARNRIYIPLYMAGALKGWQCRYIGEQDWKADGAPPKYFSCPNMMRGRVIYNFDTAVKFRTGVVMEGPTDPWSFGPMGMATFGFPMTNPQQRLLVPAFAKQAMVLLFDPDILQKESTKRKYERTVEEMQGQFQGGLAPVQLPGCDPADLERGFLRRYVEKEALGLGVKVDWNLR